MNVIQVDAEVSGTNHHPTRELMMTVGLFSHTHTKHWWARDVGKLEL
jgi:hypothetical protein